MNTVIANKRKRISNIPGKGLSTGLMNGKERISVYMMIMPTLVLFLSFCLYPVFYIFYISFFDYDGMIQMKWIGAYNYLRVLKDSSWWITVWNTVQLGIGIPLVQIPLSLVLAVILNGQIKGRNFFRAFLFLPNITSAAIMGIVFYFMFSTFNGIINGILEQLQIIQSPIDWLGNEYLAKLVIIIFSVWAGTGFYMVLFLAGLQRIPKDLYESAAIDGASSYQSFFKITVPMLGNLFRIITMLSILHAMKLFDIVRVLTNGGPGNKTEVMTMYIFSYYFEYSSGFAQQGYASAVAMVGLVITGVITGLYFLFSRKMNDEN